MPRQNSSNGLRQFIDHLKLFVFAEIIGRRQQHMVTLTTVYCPAYGVAKQAVFHRGACYRFVDLQGWIERLLAIAITNEFDADEQAAPANVTHIGMIAKRTP